MLREPILIGRKQEAEVLKRVQDSYKSEFLILCGRRRVGKTFLVNQFFDGRFTFRMTALANATTKQQLLNFHTAMLGIDPGLAGSSPPSSWFEAFQLVIKLASKDRSPCATVPGHGEKGIDLEIDPIGAILLKHLQRGVAQGEISPDKGLKSIASMLFALNEHPPLGRRREEGG